MASKDAKGFQKLGLSPAAAAKAAAIAAANGQKTSTSDVTKGKK